MTLLINSNKKISILQIESKLLVSFLSFRSVKFHYVKETHMMLVAFWRTLVKIVVASQHKMFVTIC